MCQELGWSRGTSVLRTTAKEIFPKGHQKIGSGEDLGLVEPRPMTLEQSAFPSTCHVYCLLAATLQQTAAEPL